MTAVHVQLITLMVNKIFVFAW